MYKLFLTTILVVTGLQMPQSTIENKIDAILKQMTLEEKIEMLGGQDHYFTHENKRLGIPPFRMADGPVGVRNYGYSTSMPGGINLAATWNVELAEQMGKEMARDARAKGVHFLLAPGVNIYRSPLNGRNFEYFGEDPFLASRMAVSFINGVQNQGVSATIKHFLANNSEFDRHDTNSIIDERTLREIYLPAFEAAVKEAKVGAFMDSYNLINNQHATENTQLSNSIVKQEWGFDGIIMSDWVATYDALGAALGGLDVEMPSGEYLNKEKLLPLIKEGKISESIIDDKVRRLLRVAMRFGWLDREQKDLYIPRPNPQGKQVALQAAREGIVLLKNENNFLPFDANKLNTIAVIGPNAFPSVRGGGGSSFVEPFSSVSILEGISNLAENKITVLYARGIPHYYEIAEDTTFTTADNQPGLAAEYFDNKELKGKPILTRIDEHVDFGKESDRIFPPESKSSRWSGYYTPSSPGKYVVFVNNMSEPRGFYRLFIDGNLVIDDWDKTKAMINYATIELNDKPHKIVLEQTGHDPSPGMRLQLGIYKSGTLVDKAALQLASQVDTVVIPVGFNFQSETEGSDRTFGLPPGQDELIQKLLEQNKNVVVVTTAGGNVDMNAWIDQVPAYIHAWYPGEQGGTAIAEVLFGKINPSGKLPVTFEKRWEDNPTFNSYYPVGNTKQVPYKEGIFVGYRGYEHFNTIPRYPFGFGLSYTSFSYADLSIQSLPDNDVKVSFVIKNNGKREGSEIAQVYVGELNSTISRPKKELKGFVKVSLKPGESKEVSVVLNQHAFSYYDPNTKSWKVNSGTYEILVGASSQDIRLKGTLKK